MFSGGCIDCSVKEMTKRCADAGEGEESRDRSHAEVAAAASRRVHVTHSSAVNRRYRRSRVSRRRGRVELQRGQVELQWGTRGLSYRLIMVYPTLVPHRRILSLTLTGSSDTNTAGEIFVNS